MPPWVATCWQMLSTRLVLPIDGRAATMTRSPGCRPRVLRSMSSKPVGTPVMKVLCSNSFSIFGKLSRTSCDHRDEAGLDAILGDREDRALRFVENQVGFLVRFVGAAENLVRREDQVAERRLLLDDLRVVLDVGRARHAVDERRDVGRPADFLEIAGRARAPPSASPDRSAGCAPTGRASARRCGGARRERTPSRRSSPPRRSSSRCRSGSRPAPSAPPRDCAAVYVVRGAVAVSAMDGLEVLRSKSEGASSIKEKRRVRVCAPGAICVRAIARLRFLDDGDLQLRGHVAMQLHRNVRLA